MVLALIALAVALVVVVVTASVRVRRSSVKYADAEARFRLFAEGCGDVCWVLSGDRRTTHYISPAYETTFQRPCEALYRDARDWLTNLHPDDRERMMTEDRTLDDQAHEFRLVHADSSIRWIRSKRFYVRDAAGQLLRIVSIAEDITERRALDEQLRQVQKLDALGMMAGGVAHDFNNILAVIGANAELLKESYDAGLVDEIAIAVNRAGSLTHQLLAFSRKEQTQPVVLDLNAALGDVHKLVRRLVGARIKVVCSLEPDLGRVRIDPSSLVQVIMNLAVNARDAMPDGGKLRIETRSLGLHDVMIVVKDSGCGMPPSVMARVFDPFFTTKEAGKGTGLGLAVVHGVVEQAGGRIELASAPNEGTTFRITLPVVAPPELKNLVGKPPGSQTERILVVDGDQYLRGATSHGLRERGYTVVEARDCRDATAQLAHDKPSLVIVSRMDGERVEHDPSTRVIYLDDGNPVQLDTLAAKIRSVLDERKSSLSIVA